MRWNVLALGLVLLLSPVALAQGSDGAGDAAKADSDGSAQAFAVYEEGKRLYDAKDYAGALAKFDQAAALEPSKARWQYNRGLALRKLNRYPEARDALLQSRVLDPEYKKAEIDGKLREMGFSASEDSSTGSEQAPAPDMPSRPSSPFPWGGILLILLFAAIPVWNVIRFVRRIRQWLKARRVGKEAPREGSSRSSKAKAAVRSVDVAPLEQRMGRVASSLVSVEHSLRLEEDADLRALLNQATMAEQRALDELEKARRGKVNPESLENLVRSAEQGSAAAQERARTLFGDRAFLPEGERVGCYFCARPLANASFRMQVPLKRGTDVTHVLACPPCANMVAAGQPPQVKVRYEQGGRMVHWSELGGYDPYTHRHKVYPGTRLAPAWDFTPRRSLAEVAAMAAGGALAGGLAAYGVSRLLDLDSAQETAAAQAASQAAARQASNRREERDWRDHS